MVAITQTDEHSMQVHNLLLANDKHRYSKERLKFLLSWFDLHSKKFNQAIFEERMEFLESIWTKDYFRPFDHVEAAEYYLMANTHVGYLIRLSSQPGKITITKRNKSGIIYHTRYSILPGRKLYDTAGRIFNSLTDLCTITSSTASRPIVATYV